MMKHTTVTIINSGEKWTTTQSMNSIARNRIRTSSLKEKISRNEITVLNPLLLIRRKQIFFDLNETVS
ncbi:MAG: hypothetical protein ACJA1A_002756 [Saprospiraceae bacterium]|jgi:hypothetical protein